MTILPGDTGAIVTNLQYALHILCCSPDSIDGSFGPSTQEAVRKYQKKCELTVTGHVNGGTWLRLCSDIKDIQLALTNHGYYTSYVDGIAGAETYDAILAFQRDKGLDVDGQVGTITHLYLNGYTGSTSTEDFPLGLGDVGTNVTYLQYGLHILWCHPDGIDGKFGPSTYNAVICFQERYNLDADGIVGNGTWSKMTSLITKIQQTLKNKGYYNGSVDGIPNPTTYRAVIDFQQANGLDADGMVGPLTNQELLGTTSTGGSDSFPLKIGSSGKQVLYLQYALQILCIDPNGLDGTYGPGTADAVSTFQSNNSLPSNGIVDIPTWLSIRTQIRVIQQALNNHGYDTGGVDGIAGAGTFNAVISFQSDHGLSPDGMVGPYTRELLNAPAGSINVGTTSNVLEVGSSGSLTRYLQHMLNVLGYNVPVDGTFGASTHSAIITFQTKYGLTADGIVGSGTWKTLFDLYRVPVSGSGIQRFVNVAQYECDLGFHEDNSNNFTPYGEWYGMNGQPWCAMFVSWCAYQAGIMDSTVPMFAYCPYGVNDYIERGKYYSRNSSYIPRIGDTIFFIDADDDSASHTGIVIDVLEHTVKTIEGNTSDHVGCHFYNLNNPYILGYGNNGGPSSTPPSEPTEREISSACCKKLSKILNSFSCISTTATDDILRIYNLQGGLIHTTNVSQTICKVTAPISPNLDLSLSYAVGAEIYNQHPSDESTFKLSLEQGTPLFDGFEVKQSLQAECSVDSLAEYTTSVINGFDLFCLALDTGHTLLEIKVNPTLPTPSISISYTFKTTVEIGAHFSTEVSGTVEMTLKADVGFQEQKESMESLVYAVEARSLALTIDPTWEFVFQTVTKWVLIGILTYILVTTVGPSLIAILFSIF